MQRRTFLKLITATGVLGVSTGAIWKTIPQSTNSLSLANTVQWLQAIEPEKLVSNTSWSIASTLIHMAQSIECSMTGYPEHKPQLFKDTLGTLAFSAFEAKGAMTHNLEEPIPGINTKKSVNNNVESKQKRDTKNNKSPVQAAKQRLIDALLMFDSYQQPLSEHFAYGVLNKQQYTAAHLMHIYNHFSAITIKP